MSSKESNTIIAYICTIILAVYIFGWKSLIILAMISCYIYAWSKLPHKKPGKVESFIDKLSE